jgi:hypothetical protein
MIPEEFFEPEETQEITQESEKTKQSKIEYWNINACYLCNMAIDQRGLLTLIRSSGKDIVIHQECKEFYL